VCRIQAAAFEQLIEMRHQTKLSLRYADSNDAAAAAVDDDDDDDVSTLCAGFKLQHLSS